jgi:ABC-2 type transport system permease protein
VSPSDALVTSAGGEHRGRDLSKEPLRRIGGRRGLVGGTVDSIAALWEYRELLGLLARRELKVKYKDSLFGFLWTLLKPLTLLLVYYVAIGKFLGASRSIPDFGIFVFAGLTGWFLFTEIVASATGSILGNSGLVRKIYLPREVFPLSAVGATLVNFAVQLGVLVVAVLALGGVPNLGDVVTILPLSIVVTLLFSTAIGLVTAATNVYLRDVQYLVDIVLMVVFWASPIVYSYNFVVDALGRDSWLTQVYLANPMTIVSLGFQKVFWTTAPEGFFPDHLGLRLVITCGVCAVLLWLGHRVFSRLEGNFAQEL